MTEQKRKSSYRVGLVYEVDAESAEHAVAAVLHGGVGAELTVVEVEGDDV